MTTETGREIDMSILHSTIEEVHDVLNSVGRKVGWLEDSLRGETPTAEGSAEVEHGGAIAHLRQVCQIARFINERLDSLVASPEPQGIRPNMSQMPERPSAAG